MADEAGLTAAKQPSASMATIKSCALRHSRSRSLLRAARSASSFFSTVMSRALQYTFSPSGTATHDSQCQPPSLWR